MRPRPKHRVDPQSHSAGTHHAATEHDHIGKTRASARQTGRPVLIDVRAEEDFEADPRLIPGARKLAAEDVATWGPALRGRRAVVSC